MLEAALHVVLARRVADTNTGAVTGRGVLTPTETGEMAAVVFSPEFLRSERLLRTSNPEPGREEKSAATMLWLVKPVVSTAAGGVAALRALGNGVEISRARADMVRTGVSGVTGRRVTKGASIMSSSEQLFCDDSSSGTSTTNVTRRALVTRESGKPVTKGGDRTSVTKGGARTSDRKGWGWGKGWS